MNLPLSSTTDISLDLDVLDFFKASLCLNAVGSTPRESRDNRGFSAQAITFLVPRETPYLLKSSLSKFSTSLFVI